MKTAEEKYQAYTDYMNSKSEEGSWNPFIITDIKDFYEDAAPVVEVKKGDMFVLDQYAGDGAVYQFENFDSAFQKLALLDAKNVKNALERAGF